MKRLICFVAAVLALATATGCGRPPLHRQSRVMMGTFVEVVSADRRAAPIVFAEIKRIEGILSKYDPASEVSRLNARKEIVAGPELLFILEKARYFSRISDGAFDVTVAPLVDLWGFTDKAFREPSKQDIQKAQAAVGMKKIIFKSGNPVVKFMLPEVTIDLGALAKGYAVDCAAEKLKKHGITSCLINAGGDIYCLGTKDAGPWSVAVQPPRTGAEGMTLHLSDKAVATSGDYRQYFTKDGRRYAHIIDPRTGYPARTNIASVTAVADDCLTADFLATAVFVLGEKKGRRLAARFPGTELIVIKDTDEKRQR